MAHLVWVDQGVLQAFPEVQGFVHDQDHCVPDGRNVASSHCCHRDIFDSVQGCVETLDIAALTRGSQQSAVSPCADGVSMCV